MTLYVPILKWKQGEYAAYQMLSKDLVKHVVPLFEFTPQDYDFEELRDKKTIDDHLSSFGERYKKNCHNVACFLDTHLIDAQVRMANGKLPIEFLFDQVNKEQLSGIPVVHLNADDALCRAVAKIIAKQKTGACLRITLEQVSDPDLESHVDAITQRLKIDVDQIDLVFDLQKPGSFEPREDFVDMLMGQILSLPYLSAWRSLILCGSSFPSSMAEIKSPGQMRVREEWLAYKAVCEALPDDMSAPIFGDYGIRPPGYVKLDPRTAVGKNKIIYTIKDKWAIYKGKKNNRDGGSSEYFAICKALVKAKHFLGEDYSLADKFIADCARGKKGCGPGNLNTWVKVGTNHHLTKVTKDLANLFGS